MVGNNSTAIRFLSIKAAYPTYYCSVGLKYDCYIDFVKRTAIRCAVAVVYQKHLAIFISMYWPA